MSALDRLGTVRETDVLIIGGGIAGLAAAITTKEKSPETRVLVVDKNFSGWAGQANKGAGIFMFLGPDDPVDRFLDYHTHNIGMFLEDQELLGEFAAESLATIEKLDSWCHTFCRNADGSSRHRHLQARPPLAAGRGRTRHADEGSSATPSDWASTSSRRPR